MTTSTRILGSTQALVLSVLVLAGCGGRSGLLPSEDANALLGDVQRIEQLLAAGTCGEIPAAIADAQERAGALPTSVDRRLRSRIEEGLARLQTQAPRDCLTGTTTVTTNTTTTATTATTTTTETATTPTEPQPTTPQPTTPQPTTPTTPQPTTPTTPQPTTPTTPPPSGGTSPGSGGTGGATPNTGGASP
ncbi:MAG: hypothetical protein V9E83_01715 [Baekduia sp.]